MEYTFYIDVFFLINLHFDLIILYLAALMGRRRVRWPRLLGAALLGSFLSCFPVFLPILSAPASALFLLAAGSLMNIAAFPIGNFKSLLAADGFLVAAGALTGGLFYWVRQRFYLRDGESIIFVAGLAVLAGILVKEMTRERARGRQRYRVRLSYRGACRDFLALADSGNRLRMPGTGKPVSIISYEDCQGFLELVSGVIYIPYRAVGTDCGMLPGVILEKMEIEKEDGMVVIERPVVAVTKERLSGSGDFTMLLPEELLLAEG